MNAIFRISALTLVIAFGWPALGLAAQPVQVERITESMQASERRLPGRTEAVHHVALQSRIEGVITQVHFRDGQQVQKGQLLYELDPAEYRASLALAQAELRSSEATLRQAQQLLDRYQRLKNSQALSQHDLDNARMQRDIARAAVDQAKARIKTREIQLSYTRILSPITGRVGQSQFHVGSPIAPASGTLVEIVQLDPIRIAFAIEEHRFFQKAGQHPDISELKKAWTPEVDLAGQREPGVLVSVDNKIDPRTGSVTLRGEFANPQQRLLPGGSIDVYLRSTRPKPMLLIPASALMQDAQGYFCWRVNDNQLVEQRRITTGSQLGQYYQVLSGVEANDRVVVKGVQRLRSGASVTVTE
ncbi:efflux RND transporter periplasmic adaptor subunit [Erwinia sp. MMLR14_017]|uniref:efflux RND transporter periplasmic adaptor subunit n=1 Tax=Erwinia sp. MMLR14_017 TaxID=3093842 RepID=UPI00298FAE6D|nr:efflux RND transporter periplasmic adaptor subunit [Erwinia sp. MMLR14_017]MDW8845715.1 efflux RND transporter periplasmic adaptor subunit [Erwinia sp. MMLR14_017]